MKAVCAGVLLALVLFTATAAKTDEKNVPAKVVSALTSKYPKAHHVKWDKEKGNKYEANFRDADRKHSILFEADGTIVETEVSIPVEELPETVRQYVAKNYRNQNITEAAKITDIAGVVTYEAEVGGKDLLFDVSGNPLPGTR